MFFCFTTIFMYMTKAEKHLLLQQKSEELYKQFLSDESICGLTSLFKLNKIGSKTGGHIRKILYDKYGKENVDSISFQRTAKNSHKKRTKESYFISPNRREKMKVGIKKSWEHAEERREFTKQLMYKHCHPKNQTESAKLNRIFSRKNGGGWKQHSYNSKKKMSEVFSDKWLNGDYDNRKPTLKSKGQLELIDELKKLGFEVNDEHRITSKPYDVYIKEKNLLIEFNGRYWHFDPRFYSADFYDKSRKVYARDVWIRDKNKVDEAIKYGYSIITIWQDDWDGVVDKQKYLKDLIYGINK